MTSSRGYVTVFRGDLAEDLAEAPTKRRYQLPETPPAQWPRTDRRMLGRILDGLDEV